MKRFFHGALLALLLSAFQVAVLTTWLPALAQDARLSQRGRTRGGEGPGYADGLKVLGSAYDPNNPQHRKLMVLGKPSTEPVLPVLTGTLFLWLDASDATTVSTSAGDVTSWDSKPGSAKTVQYTVPGGGVNAPAYTLAGVNGRNVVTFDLANTEGLEDVDNDLDTPPNSTYTCYVICRTTGDPISTSLGTLFMPLARPGLTTDRVEITVTGSTRPEATRSFHMREVNASGTAASIFLGNDTYTVNLVHMVVATSVSSGVADSRTLRADGGAPTTETTELGAFNDGTSSFLGYIETTANANFYPGDVCEVVFWTGAVHTAGEVALMRAYAQLKWGSQ